MHRLQLIRSVLIVGAGGIFLFLLLNLIPIHIVEKNNSLLKMAHLGFEFKNKPLNGVVYSRDSGTVLTYIAFSWNGKKQGPELQWYANGQRLIERHYEAGVESGIQKAWFENGQVRSYKTYSNGAPHGEFFDWHPNGKLAQYVIYEKGREIAAKSWTAGGKPFYNYVWNSDQPVGLRGDTFCAPKKLR